VGNVTLETVEPHISLITLNRPERLNALTFELTAELHDALDAVGADTGCKVVVLPGASVPASTCATGAECPSPASTRTSASVSAVRSSWPT
jgi:1,4-dihydroxy-2-naphthoyl-CoA synthase